MFKRKWSGLPEDPVFPSDLEGLGYFINKDDEIRSIENEDNYFKYFINRNERICDRQRFSMNQACQAEIHTRLEGLGLKKVFLPLGTTEEEQPEQPKTPIFISPDAASKSRIVVIFGETHQDLGILAHRVIGGRGGIDKGSLVTTVRAILGEQKQKQKSSAPGVILANMGELLWWPEGRRTLNPHAFDWAPMHSAAHQGNQIVPAIHHVPGNESAKAHVKYIFEQVVPALVNDAAGLDVIGLGNGADVLEDYLNNDAVWKRVGHRLNCLAIVGGAVPVWDIKCDGLRQFLRDRARAYIGSTEPLNLVLSGPDGNSNTTASTDFGCPVFSAGESMYIETLFIAAHPAVLAWMQEVALTPAEKQPYKNPEFTVTYADPPVENQYWTGWKGEDDKEEEVGEGGEVMKDEEREEEGKKKEVDNKQDDQKHEEKKEAKEMEKDKEQKEKQKEKEEKEMEDRNKHVVRVDSLDDSEDDEQW